ncbi:MAG: 16S rRNA (cytosine(1402)-N(4))-methyltransferase RsmH [Acidobacteriales bacterium]|nr:16S rRNA (cytosine(1402)-N(4))-methyltransferase RsmH [Terriglobales bacterium]
MAASGEDEFGSHSPQGDGHGREGSTGHVPVLLQEAIDFLTIRRGGTYIDATLGAGGHSLAIARRLGRQGHLIAFDKDPDALGLARRALETPPADLTEDWPRITLIHASFAEVAQRVAHGSADGLIADLGISSMQLADAGRGFSFQAEGPLDMRMDTRSERSADQVVNHMRESDLADVIYEFGEERRSRRIARAIVRARPIRSTKHLAQVVSASAPTMKSGRLHPATLTFQAIRIFVNHELDDVRAMIAGKTAGAPLVLKSGGRLVIISFHSLEDRIVKDAMRDGARDGTWRLLTKKPVTATEEEIERNPRARSAKLRAAEKV